MKNKYLLAALVFLYIGCNTNDSKPKNNYHVSPQDIALGGEYDVWVRGETRSITFIEEYTFQANKRYVFSQKVEHGCTEQILNGYGTYYIIDDIIHLSFGKLSSTMIAGKNTSTKSIEPSPQNNILLTFNPGSGIITNSMHNDKGFEHRKEEFIEACKKISTAQMIAFCRMQTIN
jgi:hypothetical protein